ncbi:MAG: hypothetical protein VYB54_09490 [Pseudomonadota bacterium]|nr:hypothetical protein [Pseudomonadota bacterium]
MDTMRNQSLNHSAMQDPGEVRRFREALADWSRRTSESPEAAREELMRLGLVTPDGKLAEPYR